MSDASGMRFLLADSRGLMREGLRALIEQHDNWAVVGEADTGDMAVELAKKLKPDVTIIDVTLPQMNGIDTTRRITENNNAGKVIAMSLQPDGHFITETLKAGGSGYILKTSAFEELVRAVAAVRAGKIYLGPQATSIIVDDYVKEGPAENVSRISTLTAKERQVLGLLTQGKSCKEIASQLRVSNKTVHASRRRIMEKLNIYDMVKLTKYAVKEGLTTLEF